MDKTKYIPLSLFVAHSVKILFTGASVVDALALAVIGSMAYYYEFKTSEKRTGLLEARCDIIDKQIDHLSKANAEIRTHIGTTQMSKQNNPAAKMRF